MAVAPLQVFINGLGLSSLYGILAVGLTIVFGVMRIINFAHGELYMVGAYSVWLFYSVGGLPFPAAVLMGVAVAGGIGIAMERGIFGPLRGSAFSGLLGAIAVMFILQVLMGQIFGLGFNKPVPSAYKGIVEILGSTLSLQRLIMIIVSFLAITGVWFFLRRTKIGSALRACSQDAEAAQLQGVNLNAVRITTMAVSGGLAGLAGAIISPIMTVSPYMGGHIILKAFVIIIVGGMGNIEGSILAAFLFGFMDSIITTVFDGTIANLVGLVFMVLILALRPRGLLNREA